MMTKSETHERAKAPATAARAGADAESSNRRRQRKFYFSDAEWAEVTAEAKRRAQYPAALVRDLILEGIRTGQIRTVVRAIRPAVNDEAVRRLNGIGVTLRQMQRAAERDGQVLQYASLAHALGELLYVVRRL